jgi:prevent-host-death family protein
VRRFRPLRRARLINATPNLSPRKDGHHAHQEADMPKKVTITEARDQLSAHIRNAEHGAPVVITRRGRAVAVIVAAEDFDQLERLGAAGPRAGLVGLAGGWKGSDDLVREIDTHHRSPPRHSPSFD